MDDRSESLIELTKALAKAQAQLKGAVKDATNPHLKSRYADLASIWDACREALTSNGLAVIQAPQVTPEGYVLKTTLAHTSGEWIVSTFPLLSDGTARSTMQSLGSACTYARRYALAAMVGVTVEDDDGEAAGVHRPQERPQQAAHAPRQDRGQWGQGERQERPYSDASGHQGPPTTGKALFAWAKKQEERDGPGLIKSINAFGKKLNLPGKMVEWTPEEVADAYQTFAAKAEAATVGGSQEPDDDEIDEPPY